ncbi:MAG: hypothetical protein ACLT98_05295 [Eggerthellaceae bacterium]
MAHLDSSVRINRYASAAITTETPEKVSGEPRIAERVAVQGMDHHDRNDGDQNHIDPVLVQNPREIPFA